MATPAFSESATTSTVSAGDTTGDVDSRLDIVFTRFRGHGDGTATLTIRTAKSWGCRYLRDLVSEPEEGASAYLFWDFDQGADGTDDTTGVFRCERRQFTFHVRHHNSSDMVFPAQRPSARSVRVTIPLSEVPGRHLGLQAMSRVTGVDGSTVFVDEEDVTAKLQPY